MFQGRIFVLAWYKNNRQEHHPTKLCMNIECVTKAYFHQENLLVSYDTEEDSEGHFPEIPVSGDFDSSMDYSMDSMDDWHSPDTGMDWTSYIRDMPSPTLIQ